MSRGFIAELQRAGINGKVYELIKSMYQNSISRVKCKHTLTDSIEIKHRVHQGSECESASISHIHFKILEIHCQQMMHILFMILRLTICYMLMI